MLARHHSLISLARREAEHAAWHCHMNAGCELVAPYYVPAGDRIASELVLPPFTHGQEFRRSASPDEDVTMPARHLIGCVVASEVVRIVNENREYDHRRYMAALEALPRLS